MASVIQKYLFFTVRMHELLITFTTIVSLPIIIILIILHIDYVRGRSDSTNTLATIGSSNGSVRNIWYLQHFSVISLCDCGKLRALILLFFSSLFGDDNRTLHFVLWIPICHGAMCVSMLFFFLLLFFLFSSYSSSFFVGANVIWFILLPMNELLNADDSERKYYSMIKAN